MNETLFTVCNSVALLGWIFLAVAPRWKWTTGLITSALIPSLLAVVYVALFFTNFGSVDGDFNSLAGVASLFQSPQVLLAGWIHYLAFDLLVGTWIARDAQRQEISHWFVLPCLLLTFLLGPTGFLVYMLLKLGMKRKIVAGIFPEQST